MEEIPKGWCQCGCGQKTKIAKESSTSKGWVKGQPLRYVWGHLPKERPWQKKKNRWIVDPETGCWEWQLAKNRDGYEIEKRKGKTLNAYIYYYEDVYGSVPEGMELDHVCSNRGCVNPDHLEPVTHKQNVWRGKRAKITYQDALKIRELHKTHTATELATMFNISYSNVRAIIKNEIWVLD